MPNKRDESGSCATGRISECLMKETSVKRKGSSLREGHGVERSDSEDTSLSFWRGKGGEEEDGRESSRVSASSSTKGSEVMACEVRED